MKILRLFIFLGILPLFFAVPYLIAYQQAPGTELASIEPLLGLMNIEKDVSHLVTTSRFKKQNVTITHDKNGDRYKLSYEWNAPQKPWPESIKFPLIVHLYDITTEQARKKENKEGFPPIKIPSFKTKAHKIKKPKQTIKELAYSAEFITQSRMSISFPAFNVVPDIHSSEIWGYHTKTQQPQIIPHINALVVQLISQYPIDPKRVYIVGCGMGATGVFSAIERAPTLYAAAIAHSGEWDIRKTKDLSTTPLYMMTGKKNMSFSPSITRALAKNIRKNNGEIIYKEISSMEHNCAYKRFYSEDVWQWLFSHK